MKFTRRAAKYILMYTSMQFLFSFFFNRIGTYILSKCDIVNNNTKQ